MKKNDPKSNYRILVVKNQNKYFQSALQNAVNLAKKIGGSIDLLYVKSPSLVINQDNQLVAWRELNEESGTAKRTMKEVVELIAATEQIPITYNFTFGNLINEVQQHINTSQPDIVVLGKSKPSMTDLLKRDLTAYLLKNFKGAILISRDEHVFGSHDDIAIGWLDDSLNEGRSKLSDDLKRYTGKPITFLKINGSDDSQLKQVGTAGLKDDVITADMTTFEFDHGTNISNSVTKYIERSGVSLLCVRKSKILNLNKKISTVTRQVQKTVQRTNTPVLVLEG